MLGLSAFRRQAICFFTFELHDEYKLLYMKISEFFAPILLIVSQWPRGSCRIWMNFSLSIKKFIVREPLTSWNPAPCSFLSNCLARMIATLLIQGFTSSSETSRFSASIQQSGCTLALYVSISITFYSALFFLLCAFVLMEACNFQAASFLFLFLMGGSTLVKWSAEQLQLIMGMSVSTKPARRNLTQLWRNTRSKKDKKSGRKKLRPSQGEMHACKQIS